MTMGARGRIIKRMLASRRGSLLVVALLVMLALASVALVTVNKVVYEQHYAGNHRRGTIAYRATESGAHSVLGVADRAGASLFKQVLDRILSDPNNPCGEYDNPIPCFYPDALVDSGVVPYFDLAGSGSFGFEGYIAGKDAQGNPLASEAPVDFRVGVTEIAGAFQVLTGYSVSGANARCRRKHQIDSDGRIGKPRDSEGVDNEAGFGFNAVKRIRTFSYVPDACKRQRTNLGNLGGP